MYRLEAGDTAIGPVQTVDAAALGQPMPRRSGRNLVTDLIFASRIAGENRAILSN